MISGDTTVQQTKVSLPTQNPIWNATLTFDHISAENLMERYIDIQVWDLVPHIEPIFLGECNIELQIAFLDDRAIWYRLEDPKGLRGISMSKSANVLPRGLLILGGGYTGDVCRLLQQHYHTQRSNSGDLHSVGDSGALLQPDYAWIAGSRRGSSQSDIVGVESYQLLKDFSHLVPGSRRLSFQDADKNQEDDIRTPPTSYLMCRRRSSVTRRNSDEILKSFKAVRGELERTMSLGTEQIIKPIGLKRK